jgi:hypothetical protein
MKFRLFPKAKGRERLIDAVSEPGQRRGTDPGPKDSGCPLIRKKTHSAKRNLKYFGANATQALPDVVSVCKFAEKFQGDVISVAANETYSGKAGLQGAHIIVQPLLDDFVDVQCHK